MNHQQDQTGRSFLKILRSHFGPATIEGYHTEKIHLHNDEDHS